MISHVERIAFDVVTSQIAQRPVLEPLPRCAGVHARASAARVVNDRIDAFEVFAIAVDVGIDEIDLDDVVDVVRFAAVEQHEVIALAGGRAGARAPAAPVIRTRLRAMVGSGRRNFFSIDLVDLAASWHRSLPAAISISSRTNLRTSAVDFIHFDAHAGQGFQRLGGACRRRSPYTTCRRSLSGCRA